VFLVGTHTDLLTSVQRAMVSKDLDLVIERWRYAFRGATIKIITDIVCCTNIESLLCLKTPH
jgi:hypothetical protein